MTDWVTTDEPGMGHLTFSTVSQRDRLRCDFGHGMFLGPSLRAFCQSFENGLSADKNAAPDVK